MNKRLLSVNWEQNEPSKDDSEQAAEADARSGAGLQSSDSPIASPTQPHTWRSIAGATSPRYCKVLGIPPKLLGSMKGIELISLPLTFLENYLVALHVSRNASRRPGRF
ncbi:hypothetical protein H4Q26_017377 [Puccinia striiformis f. sp. tritici PST-130]|nr:hypothetical protein H4Q26_017377 [Puccinia striiformis f. sp. tritici PST-130]